jgi:lambda family phage tail tape measure protein
MSTAATIDVLLRANTAQYRAAMIDAGRVANQNLGLIQQEAKKTAAVMANFQKAAVGFISVQALRSSAGALLEVTKQQQALVNAMKASTGSAKLSADALSFVGQTAKTLGLDFQTAAEGFQRMTASASANGIAMQDQQRLFLEVSRAATALQIAPEKVDRAMTALSQSFSKGRFQAEELRQQLAEAIPGVVPRFQIAVMKMVEGTNLAGKSFDQLLQGGMLDVKKFLPAMTQAFAELGVNWKAESNRLGNAWRDMKLGLAGGAFSDTAIAGIKGATIALEGMGTVLPILVPAAASLAAVKLGESAAGWVRGLNAVHAATIAEAVAAEQATGAILLKARAEVADALAVQKRALAIGGSLAADVNAIAAVRAHDVALRAHTVASNAAAAASGRLAIAGKSALAFFGGPAGLAFVVASTAISWLAFRDNTNAASQALVDWAGSADQAISKFKELNALQQASEIAKLQDSIKAKAEQFESDMASITGSVQQLFAQGFDRSLGAYDLYPESAQAAARAYLATTGALVTQFQAGKLKADEYSAALATANTKLLEDEAAARLLKDRLLEKAGVVGTLTRELQHNQAQLDTLTGKQGTAASAADNHAAALRGLAGAAQSATAQMGSLFGSFSDSIWQSQIEWIRKTKGEYAAFQVTQGKAILDKGGPNAMTPEERSAYNATDAFMKQHFGRMKAYDEQKKAAKAAARTQADAGQDALRAAQARQQEYQLEIAAGDALNSSRRELLKFELLLRDTRDKTIKSKADEIRAILQANVVLEDQIDATRRLQEEKLRGLAVDRQIADDMEAMQKKHARDMQALRHGGNTAAWNGIANGVSDQFRDMRKQMDGDLQNRLATIPLDQFERRNAEQNAYLELIGKTVIAESEAMAQSRKNFEEMLAAQSDWRNGMRSSIEDYIAAAEDIAGQTKNLTNSFLQGTEDLLTDFFMKGKADWRGYFDSIAAEFMRMAVRSQISKLMKKFLPGLDDGSSGASMQSAASALSASAMPLYGAAAALQAAAASLAAAGVANGGTAPMGGAGGGGGGWTSMFTSILGMWSGMSKMGGGYVASSNGVTGQQFADVFDDFMGGWAAGGYTGPGGRNQPAGMVHKGEGVLSQPEINALGGESGFNALRRAIRSGYANGGMVGGSGRVRLGRGPEDSAGPGAGRGRPLVVEQHFHNPRMYDRSSETQRAADSAMKLKEGTRFA